MNGILIVNKPKNFTSHDVVAKVKTIYKVKVGHTGTLDPMATGVLPLLLGKGTKLSEYLINHNKIYEAIIKLGEKTDTLDSEGKVIETKEVNLENLRIENVKEILQSMVGKQKQTPPMYSAIKINGKKLYEYARNGQQVEIPQREIEIYSIELIEINENLKTVSFRVHCSKGTYIRTLCEEIAKRLQTVGYMKELNRVKVGSFDISEAITLQELEENKNNTEYLNKHIITIPYFFKDYPIIHLTEQEIKELLNGVKLQKNVKNGLYQIQNKNEEFIGIGIVQNNLLKRKLMLY